MSIPDTSVFGVSAERIEGVFSETFVAVLDLENTFWASYEDGNSFVRTLWEIAELESPAGT